MSRQPTPKSNSPKPSDELEVVSADGVPVSEPTFEEKVQVFWIENKNTILLTCALIVVVLVGKELVLHYIDRREKAIGVEFAQAENDAAKLAAFTAAHPDHKLAGLAWLAMGDIAFKAGNYTDAAADYAKAGPLTVGSAFGGRARIGEAFSQSLGGDKATAETSFKAIVDDMALPASTRAEARYHLAVIAVEAGRVEDARKELDELQSVDLQGAWLQRAMVLRMGLPPAPAAAAESSAAAGDAGLTLNLPGSN